MNNNLLRKDRMDQETLKENNRISLLLNLLRDYVEDYNKNKHQEKTERLAKNEFSMFQIWHDMHFQFEEHWKFAGLTSSGLLNPNYIHHL
jgi:hypothetical protein